MNKLSSVQAINKQVSKSNEDQRKAVDGNDSYCLDVSVDEKTGLPVTVRRKIVPSSQS